MNLREKKVLEKALDRAFLDQPVEERVSRKYSNEYMTLVHAVLAMGYGITFNDFAGGHRINR